MSNKIVVGNRIMLIENEQQQERKDNWHAIVTLRPNNKGNESIVTVKSMVRFLTKKFQDIGNFPEGMTLDELYVYGEVFSSYDDENVVHKKSIRPGDKDVSGLIGVYETHMKFTFDHSEYATIDEMIALSNFVYSVATRNYALARVIDINGSTIELYNLMFSKDTSTFESSLLKIHNKINNNVEWYKGPDFNTLWTEWNNMINMSYAAKQMFYAVNFEPDKLWLACDDEQKVVEMIVWPKRTVSLGEITKTYYIFKNYVYPDADVDFYLTVQKGGKVLLDTKKTGWLKDKNFEILFMKKEQLIPGRGISPEELIETYKDAHK